MSEETNIFLTRLVRTTASFVWAWLALRLVSLFGWSFTPEESAAVVQGIQVVLGAAIYGLVAYFSKRFPALEYILVIPSKPIYRISEKK
jgi:hypothetical protein